MGRAVTVLLVREHALPAGLDEELERRSVRLEEVLSEDLLQAVDASAPDAVVYAGSEDVARILDAVEGHQRPVPVAVVTAAAEHPLLQTAFPGRRVALFELELPATELARRLADFAHRAPQPEPTATDVGGRARVVLFDEAGGSGERVAAALRAQGVEVRVVSPRQPPRWLELRRFSPHALLVDEGSLVRGGRPVLAALRRDPFLRHAPLMPVRFDGLAEAGAGSARLAPLLRLLEPLGRDERELLERLAVSGHVDVDAAALAPARLLELMARDGERAQLVCASGGQRLTWALGGGQAGEGRIIAQGGASGERTLPPARALSWLLEQELPRLRLERGSFPLGESAALEELLERARRELPEPTERDKELPAAPGANLHAAPGSPSARGALTLDAPPPSAEPLPRVVTAEPKPTGEPAAGQAGVSARRLSSLALDALLERARLLLPRERFARLSPRAIVALLAGLGVLLGGLLAAVLLGRDAEVPAAAPSPAASAEASAAAELPVSPAPAGDPGASPDPSVLERARAAERSLWHVADDALLPSCDELVGAAVASEPRTNAALYAKQARAELERGEVKSAEGFLCRAALLDVKSPAVELLAEYYLGRRSLANAERWLIAALEAEPERAAALELLADVRCQEGRLEVARALLLESAKLAPEDAVRRGALARRFAAASANALKNGNLPLAERLLRRAALLEPERAETALALAQVLLRSGLHEAASLWASEALRRTPALAGAHVVLGDVARLAGRSDEARAHYGKVPVGDPERRRVEDRLRSMPID